MLETIPVRPQLCSTLTRGFLTQRLRPCRYGNTGWGRYRFLVHHTHRRALSSLLGRLAGGSSLGTGLHSRRGQPGHCREDPTILNLQSTSMPALGGCGCKEVHRAQGIASSAAPFRKIFPTVQHALRRTPLQTSYLFRLLMYALNSAVSSDFDTACVLPASFTQRLMALLKVRPLFALGAKALARIGAQSTRVMLEEKLRFTSGCNFAYCCLLLAVKECWQEEGRHSPISEQSRAQHGRGDHRRLWRTQGTMR